MKLLLEVLLLYIGAASAFLSHTALFSAIKVPVKFSAGRGIPSMSLKASGLTKTIGGKEVSAPLLRNLILTNYKDEKVRVGDVMREGKSVVIFLRHLG